MCGIAGIWGDDDVAAVRAMIDRLSHRGPDGEGLFAAADGATVLGHARLAVMDPQGGHQPMEGDRAPAAIVGNGEIYNYPELREDLELHHRFSSGSDTEVALHLYEDLGPSMARRLDGMFALAIADGDGLFLARDPLGIKPLYVGRRNAALVFASEIKALAGAADQVQRFPPGTCFHSSTGFRPFYDVPDRQPRDFTLDTALRLVRETLLRAVEKRLMSDVPVGVFLSGGLDSSVVAALMRERVDELHTFSVGLEGSPDLQAARRVAEHLDARHHESVFTVEDIERHLPEIVFHLESFDQHLVRSAVPCFFCARLAADHVKVVLTGEGADELFAGYSYLRGIREEARLHDELRRLVTGLHGLNLQRVDRLTMAHSLEARVPFLDIAMVQLAQVIPPRFKLYDDGSGRRVEKWILRRAFEDLLPGDIVWRAKEQFDEGTGTSAVIAALCERALDLDAARRYSATHHSDALRSVEECYYHQLLVQPYERPRDVLADVSRWAPR
jgi:asparagine synthase (glutamine-hydrolysing)